MTEQRKLRMGLVGGGPGAFIGPVHRIAAELDGRIEMVAGAFSQSPERSRAAASRFASIRLGPMQSYEEMLQAERKRGDGIDFVVIATPNHLHLPMAQSGAGSGHSRGQRQARYGNLRRSAGTREVVTKAGLPYALTHTYAGYALVRDARSLCASGELGEDSQGSRGVSAGMAQPAHRAHRAEAGRVARRIPRSTAPAAAIGDIGTHALSPGRVRHRSADDGHPCHAAFGGSGPARGRRLHRVVAAEQRRDRHADVLRRSPPARATGCAFASMARTASLRLGAGRSQLPAHAARRWPRRDSACRRRRT